MKFRQDEASSREDPLDFVQRRIRHHRFLFIEDDGPLVVQRILRMAPPEWHHILNPNALPSISLLQYATKSEREALMALWRNTQRMRQFNAAVKNVSRRANLAQKEDSSPSDVEEAMETDKSDTIEAEAHIACHGGSSFKSQNAHPRRNGWPKGKTINGYEFRQRDDVRSSVKPSGDCFICTSPYHLARECPHWSRWDAL